MIPDYFEALTAHRAWNCVGDGLLVGVTHSMAWPPMEPHIAQCAEAEGSHLQNGRYLPAPIYDCSCGTYAMKQMTRETFGCGCYACQLQWNGTVWGTVSLWGKVIEHKLGYRAQYAYPKELWSRSQERARQVEQLYGVPCHYEEMPKREGEESMDLATYPPSVRPVFLGLARSSFKFWRNQQTPNLVPLPSRYTADPTPPAIVQPTFNQIRSLGASRWQKLNAGRRGGKGIGMVYTPTDWRQALRKMVYVSGDNVKLEEMVDGLTLNQQLYLDGRMR